MAERRALCQAIWVRIQPILGALNAQVHHQDAEPGGREARLGPGRSLRRAPRFDTPAESDGASLRLRRLGRGWTLDELAKRSGVAKTHLSRIERGRVIPRSGTRKAIEAAIGAGLG